MAMIEVRFSLEKETKGALGPHQEVDDKGEVRENRHPVHCKSVFERDAVFPQKLRVTVETGSAPNLDGNRAVGPDRNASNGILQLGAIRPPHGARRTFTGGVGSLSSLPWAAAITPSATFSQL
jgi:hypothetical protein